MNAARGPALLLLVLLIAPFLPPLVQGEVFSLRDHSDYFVPMRHFTAEVLRSGSLPLWNPYSGAGEPWLANPQTAVFYPPALLFVVFPFPFAYMLFLALHLLLLGFGCFALFGRWCSPAAAAFGGVAASLSGSTLSLLDTGNNLCSLAWLPWIIHVAMQEPPRSRVVAAPLLLTLCFLGGEPLIAAIAAAAYAAIVLVKGGTRAIVPLIGTGALTAALSAAQLLPFLELLAGTDRATGFDPEVAFRHSATLRDWAAVAVAPWAFSSGGWLPLSQTYIPSVYLGVPAALAALVALLAIPSFRRDDRVVWKVSIVLAAVALLALVATTVPSTGWGRELFLALRLNVSRYPSRLIPFGALAIAGLAAIGMDRLPRTSALVRAGAVAGVMVLLALFGAELRAAPGPPWKAAAGFGFLGLAAALMLFLPRLFQRPAAVAAVAAVLAADLYAAARPLLVTGRFRAESSPYSALLPEDRRFARLHTSMQFDRWEWTAGYRNLLERKFDLSSPAPVMSREYLRLHDAALYERRLDLLRFLSVEALITDRDVPLPVITASRDVNLLRLPPSLPFAAAWVDGPRWKLEGGAGRGEDAEMGRLDSTAKASPVRWTPRSASLEVELQRPALLTLNQMQAPGWKVNVSGRRADPVLVNGIFRGVQLSAGHHAVEWRYDPLSVRAGIWISTMAILFLISRASAHFVRRKKSRHHVVVP
jgi:hypothetical protein